MTVPHSIFSWIKEGKRSPLARGALATKPQAPKPAASVGTFDPNRFAHLRRPASAAPAARNDRRQPPSSDADDFARRVLAVDASARGEKFDGNAFVDTPQPPPVRQVSGRDIASAVLKITGE